MKIIISPAKKMTVDNDIIAPKNSPKFLNDTKSILANLRQYNYDGLKSVWNCSEKIANENFEIIKNMELEHNLTPAILAYNGIQYKYMAPSVFDIKSFEYIETHLRILSGFYGVLKPFDGVKPYRLEMQAKLTPSLYDFWGDKLAKELFSETDLIINLASKEYSKCISHHLNSDIQFISCVFGEFEKGKIIEKGTRVKMARGEMVRFMADNNIIDGDGIKQFNRLDYEYNQDLSTESKFVFLKNHNRTD